MIALSLALVAGLIVVGAAAAAVTLTDGRAVAGALFLALAVSPFATDPLPGALEIAARLVAAMLAAYVLWIVMKGGEVKSAGSALGIAAELGIAAAAFTIGWWIEPVHPLQGPIAEQATGFAVVALAVLPLAGSNVLRAGIGVVLVVLGAGLVMQAWLGPAPALVQLALTVLLLAIPAGLSLVVDADDSVARLVPAVEQTRVEQASEPEPIASRRPKLELEAPASVVPGMPASPDPSTAPAAEDRRSTADAGTDSAPPGATAKPSRRTGRSAAPDQKPVVGPRPSVRFLGSATVRRGADLPDMPDAAREDGETAPADAGPASAGPDEPAIRDVRELRNPRYKRPLR